MIKSITIINNIGEKKVIELGAPEKSGLWVKSIKGIGPGKANINVTDLATSDGGIYNSSRSEVRNITMTIGFVEWYDGIGKNRITHTVQEVRRDLYKWFAKKRFIDFIINLEQIVKISDTEYYTKRINLGSSGYVESNEPDIFNKQETAAISIICPDPNMYLYDDNGKIISDAIDFSATNDGFEFPMVIVKTTDTEFLPDKIYYEKIEGSEYKITEDEEMIPGKSYYEEIKITEISKGFYTEEKCNEGYENPISSEEPYFETSDTEMKTGKEYFEFVNGEYIPTEDVGSFNLEKTYYEYESVTELATLSTIAVKETSYDGEIEIGLIFRIYIYGEVSGLSLYKVYDAYNYDSINIDDEAISLATGSGLNSGDEIRICTIVGKKSAVLIREASEYNIMNALGKNPDWFKLDQGVNKFSYGAISGSENVSVNIEYSKAYEGI